MDGYQLDVSRIRRGFDRAAETYDEFAVLGLEVNARLLERLDYVAVEPDTCLDLGAGTGAAVPSIQKRFPQTALIAVDSSPQMLRQHQKQCAADLLLLADMRQLPIAGASLDLLYSNLALPWVDDLDATLSEWRRICAPGALLTFSTFGPDTLTELRQAWRAADPHEHVHGFIDMHDIGDALLRCGFADPVMDVERFTLTYEHFRELLFELRQVGSVNALATRSRGLLSMGRYKALQQAYECTREDARLQASFEVIYGHAWVPLSSAGARLDDGITTISPAQIGRRRNRPV